MIAKRRAVPVNGEPDLSALIDDFFRSSFVTENPVITEAVRRMLAAGGKRLRPQVLLLAAEAVGADARDHLALAAYIELIHVATLIHDDVVDRADTRRGVNATNVDFGNRISVLAGDYLFAWIFRNVTANYPPPIPHVLSATLAAICDGEVLQLRALGNLGLRFAEYADVVEKKTATLFAAAAECGAIIGGGDAGSIAALRDFGRSYGIAFQIEDDLLDVTAQASDVGKPVGNDLRERKVTAPVILAYERGGPSVRKTLERLYAGKREATDGDVRDAVAAVSRGGAAAATREAIRGYVERAKGSLAPLGPRPACAKLVALAEALVR